MTEVGTMSTAEIIVAMLALLGSLAGAYFPNRKNNALIAYRLEQVEKKVDRLDLSNELQELRERVAVLEEVIQHHD